MSYFSGSAFGDVPDWWSSGSLTSLATSATPLITHLSLEESEDVGPGMLVAISVSCILMLRGTHIQIIIRVKHIRRPCHGDVVVD